MLYLRHFLVAMLTIVSVTTHAINMKVGETEILDIGEFSHLQGCQWTISRPNDIVFVTTPQSYTTRVTIKAVNSFPTTTPCIIQCKFYYLEIDPTTGRYTYSRTGYKDWTVFVKGNNSDDNDDPVDNETLSLSPSEITIKVGNGENVYASGTYSGKLTWSIDCKGSIASIVSTQNNRVWCYGESEGTTYLRATSTNGKQAVCKVNVVPQSIMPDNEEDYEIVDLGLSINWASKNLGAKNPEDVGDYYAWGEVSPKSSYNEHNSDTYNKNILNFCVKENYEHCYSFPINYDAAYQKLGSKWSIPTKSQWDELCQKCTWIPILNSNNDFIGVKVIGKNKKYIYLPITGCKENNSFNPNFSKKRRILEQNRRR